ncbi:MAG: hypothetical protein M0R02_10785, partial [Bacteroidales bacterium]|nr:hypothetical protein [Bacteroidales bacterium]
HPPPRYGHIPLVVDAHGQKLSKQNHAPSLDAAPPADNLSRALAWLGLDTEPRADIANLLADAVARWRRE